MGSWKSDKRKDKMMRTLNFQCGATLRRETLDYPVRVFLQAVLDPVM